MRAVTVYLEDDAGDLPVVAGELGRSEELTDPVMGYREAKRSRYRARRGDLVTLAADLQALDDAWPTMTAADRQEALRATVLPAVRMLAIGLRWIGDLVVDEHEDAGPTA